MVKHHVESQHLEAHIVGIVFRMNCLLDLGDCGIPRDHGFYEHVVNPCFELVNIVAHLSDEFKSATQCPFVALVTVYINTIVPSRL